MRLLSVPMLSKKTVLILPKCPGSSCQWPPFLTHEHTFLSYPPAPNIGTGFGREPNDQFCPELTELDFSTRILEPGIIFFKNVNLRPNSFS